MAGHERTHTAHPARATFRADRRAGPLIEALQRAAQRCRGDELPLQGVPIYTDARHYTAAGVPTVLYGAGPRTLEEANGHRADERLVLADLHKATLVVALALADLLAA